jgi:hypothetical protein
MYGEGYSEVIDYGAIDALPNPGYGAAVGMFNGPVGRPGVKMLMLISWCRKWPMFCRINSALNLRCRDKLTLLLSQNGTTGWFCHQE